MSKLTIKQYESRFASKLVNMDDRVSGKLIQNNKERLTISPNCSYLLGSIAKVILLSRPG